MSRCVHFLVTEPFPYSLTEKSCSVSSSCSWSHIFCDRSDSSDYVIVGCFWPRGTNVQKDIFSFDSWPPVWLGDTLWEVSCLALEQGSVIMYNNSLSVEFWGFEFNWSWPEVASSLCYGDFDFLTKKRCCSSLSKRHFSYTTVFKSTCFPSLC